MNSSSHNIPVTKILQKIKRLQKKKMMQKSLGEKEEDGEDEKKIKDVIISKEDGKKETIIDKKVDDNKSGQIEEKIKIDISDEKITEEEEEGEEEEEEEEEEMEEEGEENILPIVKKRKILRDDDDIELPKDELHDIDKTTPKDTTKEKRNCTYDDCKNIITSLFNKTLNIQHQIENDNKNKSSDIEAIKSDGGDGQDNCKEKDLGKISSSIFDNIFFVFILVLSYIISTGIFYITIQYHRVVLYLYIMLFLLTIFIPKVSDIIVGGCMIGTTYVYMILRNLGRILFGNEKDVAKLQWQQTNV